MDVVTKTVNPTPRKPYRTEVVLVVATSYDHVERIAELMCRSTGRRCRIRATPCDVAIIETDLLTVGAKSACYTGLDPSSTCKVYKVSSWLLEFWD